MFSSGIRHCACGMIIAVLLVWWIGERFFSGAVGNAYPRKPVQIIVPYPAGGGSDTFVRILQKGIIEKKLFPQPVVVFNHRGGSGTVGSRKVKDAKPDGYTILCSHNAVITAKLSGTVDYGVEAFRPICLTGTMAMVIIVREDSPYADLPSLLEAAREKPRKLAFGANQGAPAYFTTLQLLKCVPGAEFSIVSADGGADRYSRILGGHLDAGIFSLSEYLDFRRPDSTPSAENVRALVLLSPGRHEAIPQVPTSREQGIPVFSQNANYWFAPRGTPDDAVQYLSAKLGEAMEIESVRERLKDLRIDPEFKAGQEFEDYLDASEEEFLAVAAQKQTRLPNFPLIVAMLVGGLFIAVIVERLIKKETDPVDRGTIELKPAFIGGLLLLAYILCLQFGWLPFALATAIIVFAVGGLISKWKPGLRVYLLELAMITALGSEFIFTKIFSVALP